MQDVKFRVRDRLFDQETLSVGLSWCLEFEYQNTPQLDDASWELEHKPVIEKDLGPFSLIVNPVFENGSGAGKHQGFEFG
jgi:hypothetical protein